MFSATSCNGHKLEQRSCSLVKSMSHYWLYIPVAHPHLHVLPKYDPGWGTGGGQERNLGIGVSTTVVFGGMGRWRGTRQQGYTQPRSMHRRDSCWTQKGEEERIQGFISIEGCSAVHFTSSMRVSVCDGNRVRGRDQHERVTARPWLSRLYPHDCWLCIRIFVAFLCFFQGTKWMCLQTRYPQNLTIITFPPLLPKWSKMATTGDLLYFQNPICFRSRRMTWKHHKSRLPLGIEPQRRPWWFWGGFSWVVLGWVFAQNKIWSNKLPFLWVRWY